VSLRPRAGFYALEAGREHTKGPLVLRPLTGQPIDRRDASRTVHQGSRHPRRISNLDRHAVYFLTAYVAGV
jgi:hypothetical protein